MVTRQMGVVDVQQLEDFDDLLRSLDQRSGCTVTIDVMTDVDVLTEPAEFEALLCAARLHDVAIELATDDPIRQELGRIYGLRLTTGPAFSAAQMMGGDARTVRLPAIWPDEPGDLSSTKVQNGQIETAPFPLTPASASPFDTDASFSFVLAPPDIRNTPLPAVTRTRPGRRDRKQAVSRGLGSSSLVVSGMVIAAAIAVLLTALLAPSAAIVIVPETRDISSSVTFGFVGSGQPLDVEITPTSISSTVTFEGTAPATGERTIPDDAARGMVFLTNPFSEVVVLPAGTIFAPQEGDVSYETLERIEVPAADPFESARFGTAAVGIQAVQAGTVGNLDVGELSGAHETGILFQNRFPVDGGTEMTVATVTQQDIESLRHAARDDLEIRASSALNDELAPGWELVGEPQIDGEMSAEFSAEPGTDAEEVTINAMLAVQGQMYDPAAVEEQARDNVLAQLASQVPSSFGLVMESVRLSSPQQVGDSGQTAFRIEAEATAAAQFDSDQIDELAEDFSGHGENHAATVLDRTPGVESYSLAYGPSWLPWDPIPRFTNRVSVDVRGP